MTYQEIKERLTQCEVKLKELHSAKETVKSSKNYNVAVEKLTVLKESLEKRLSEAEKTAFVNGQATEYTDEKELQKLKTASYVVLDTELPKIGKRTSRWSIQQNLETETIKSAIYT